MGLETASYISQLVPGNPVGGVDNYSTADEHLRLVKTVLQTQFPNLGAAAVTMTAAQLNNVELQANKNQNNGYAGLNGSAQLADARVAVTNVTQHQASLALAASQTTSGIFAVARLGSGSPGAGNWLNGAGVWQALATTDIASGTFADARIATSNVTQHQAALAIACSQLTGNMSDARIVASNVTQHQASLAIASSQLTGNMPDARIVASNVTQHQASITAVNAAATVNGFTIGYRFVPRRTSGFANNECLSTAAGQTLNTSDMSAGFCFSIYNNSGSDFTLTQGAGVTLRQGGTANMGNRTIKLRGVATIWCESGTEAVISGNVA